MNYNLKLDFAKLKKVGVANITGKTGNKVKCVVIPVEVSIHAPTRGATVHLSIS